MVDLRTNDPCSSAVRSLISSPKLSSDTRRCVNNAECSVIAGKMEYLPFSYNSCFHSDGLRVNEKPTAAGLTITPKLYANR